MAESRTIRTVLELNVSKFQAGAARASAATKDLARDLNNVSKATGDTAKSYDRVGNMMLTAGGAMAAGMGFATKAAMDWESAWAGVTKTVDGTPEQMSKLEGELRNLAKTLPASHQEIAAVAEAAGQLGVERESVASFTKTMIDLGETTNLSADEAATSLARFNNIMGLQNSEVSKLGSALVGLGNNYATTEAEIMQMSMRLAGTGKQLNMSAGDVMGFATAMSSVGIEAEAGGTAMSTVLKKIDKAVNEGGDSLEGFAKVAGMSAKDFAAAWKKSPSQAMVSLTQGMDKVRLSGGSLSETLNELGIKGIREQDTMLRLASAHEVLAGAIGTGNTEFEKNTALLEEANKRYETSEAKMKIAFNAITDAAIDLGASLLPIIANVAAGAAELAKAFQALPGPVKGALGVLGSLAGAGLLAGGAFLKLAPAVRTAISDFKTLRATLPTADRALGGTMKAVGVLSKALGVAGLVGTMAAVGKEMSDFTLSATELTKVTLGLADSSDRFGTLFQGMILPGVKEGKEFSEALKWMADPDLIDKINNLGADVFSAFGANAAGWDDAGERLRKFGMSLAELGKTDMGEFTKQFKALWEMTDQSEGAFANLLKIMPEFEAHLIEVAKASGIEVTQANLLKLALGELQPTTSAAAESMENATEVLSEAEQAAADTKNEIIALNDALQDIANAFLDSRAAARQFAEAQDQVAEAAKKNGKHWEDGTQNARANAEALDKLSAAGLKNIDAMTANGEATSGAMKSLREQIIQTAMEMGASKEQAEAYAQALGLTPERIDTQVHLETQEAQASLDLYLEKFGEAPPSVLTTVGIETHAAEENLDVWNQKVEASDGQVSNTTITADNSEAIVSFEEAAKTLNVVPEYRLVMLSADSSQLDTKVKASELQLAYLAATSPEPKLSMDAGQFDRATAAAEARIKEIDGMKPTPHLTAEKKALERVVAGAKQDLAGVKDKKVKVDTSVTGKGELKDAKRTIDSMHSKEITVKVRGIMTGMQAAIKAATGRASGGWLAPGLSSGGWVPGAYPGPGVDNVLWPYAPGAAGGRYLSQPLAGNEFVVNGAQARKFGPVLEAINAGMIPDRAMTSAPSVPSSITVMDADGTLLARMRTVGTDAAVSVVNQR